MLYFKYLSLEGNRMSQEKQRSQTVVVLGASDKTHRYAYKAIKLLKNYGHIVIPVHPNLDMVDNTPVVSHLTKINSSVDTLSLYIGAERSQLIINEIITLKPKRVIFNPGTESEVLEKELLDADIPFVHDCTLVMLETGQFSG